MKESLKRFLKTLRNFGILICVLVIGYFIISTYGDPKVSSTVKNAVSSVRGFVSDTSTEMKTAVAKVTEPSNYDFLEGTWYTNIASIDDAVESKRTSKTYLNLAQVFEHQSYFMIKNYGDSFELASYYSDNDKMIHTRGERYKYLYQTTIAYDNGRWSEKNWKLNILFDKSGTSAKAIMTPLSGIENSNDSRTITFELSRHKYGYVFGEKEDRQIISDLKKYSDNEAKYNKLLKKYHNQYCQMFGEEPIEIEKSMIEYIEDFIGKCIDKSKSSYKSIFNDASKEIKSGSTDKELSV